MKCRQILSGSVAVSKTGSTIRKGSGYSDLGRVSFFQIEIKSLPAIQKDRRICVLHLPQLDVLRIVFGYHWKEIMSESSCFVLQRWVNSRWNVPIKESPFI